METVLALERTKNEAQTVARNFKASQKMTCCYLRRHCRGNWSQDAVRYQVQFFALTSDHKNRYSAYLFQIYTLIHTISSQLSCRTVVFRDVNFTRVKERTVQGRLSVTVRFHRSQRALREKKRKFQKQHCSLSGMWKNLYMTHTSLFFTYNTCSVDWTSSFTKLKHLSSS